MAKLSGKKRKIYLLNQNHDVIKSKSTIAQLKREGALDRTEWVLIPIRNTSATYIAVDATTILSQNFDYADVRFHMKMKDLYRADKNDPREITLYDYYTTTLHADTIEELYNALYNVMVFRYIKELFGDTDSVDTFWFIDVADLEISLFKNQKRIKHFYVEAEKCADEVPFEYSATDEMSARIAQYFGLKSADSWITMANIYFKKDKKGLKWYETNKPVDLFSDVYAILDSNPFAKSFVMLRADAYDAALRMHNAMLYITPVALSGDTIDYDVLPIASAYGLSKYEFNDGKYADDNADAALQIYHDYSPGNIPEIFSFDIKDESGIMFMLDNLTYIMQVYLEGIKVWMSDIDNRDDLQYYQHRATLVANMIIDLESAKGHPSDNQLVIYTDPYEDYPPNLAEVCYLLELQENS